MPDGGARLHDLGRPPFLPPGVRSVQGLDVFGEGPGDDQTGAFAEDPLQARAGVQETLEADQRNFQEGGGGGQMRLGEMDGGGGFVGVEGKGGRPFVPRVERQGDELLVVIGDWR